MKKAEPRNDENSFFQKIKREKNKKGKEKTKFVVFFISKPFLLEPSPKLMEILIHFGAMNYDTLSTKKGWSQLPSEFKFHIKNSRDKVTKRQIMNKQRKNELKEQTKTNKQKEKSKKTKQKEKGQKNKARERKITKKSYEIYSVFFSSKFSFSLNFIRSNFFFEFQRSISCFSDLKINK